MLRESKLFLTERMEYQQVVDSGGIYTLGTFVPEDTDKLNNNFVQMVPTKNSKLMFDTIRENFGYKSFDESFGQDPTVYTASGKTSMVLTDKIYNTQTHITNISTEYLDNVGIYLGSHSIRLVELTETGDTFYYVLVGGKGALEAKADELFNTESSLYDGEPFRMTDMGITLDSAALVELGMAMANDIFDRHWTKDDAIDTEHVFGVDTPHAIEMGELDRWIPLEQFKSWGEPVRLGVVFAVQKEKTNGSDMTEEESRRQFEEDILNSNNSDWLQNINEDGSREQQRMAVQDAYFDYFNEPDESFKEEPDRESNDDPDEEELEV